MASDDLTLATNDPALRKRLVNFGTLNALFFSVLWMVVMIFMDAPKTSIPPVFATIASVTALFLIRVDRIDWGANLLTVSISVAVFIASFTVEHQSHVIYLEIVMLITAFLFFYRERYRKVLVFHFSFITLLWFIGSVVNVDVLGPRELSVYVSDTYIFPLVGMSIIATLIGALSFFWGQTRKNLHGLVEAVQKAQAADRAKSQFLATMSHEIRTPMNGVVGIIEILKQTELEQEQKDLIGIAHKSSFALLRVIDDILETSKIEANKVTLKNAPVSVASLTESVTSLLGASAIKANVTLVTDIAQDVPGQFLGDEGRITQILFNLTGNAIKFSDANSGGPSKIVRLSVTIDEQKVLCFSVADKGIGMDDDQVKRLFAPFTQFEDTNTRKFGGTGLGLFISYRLAELMDGRLDVESEQGVGTKFTLTLPYQAVEILNEDQFPINDVIQVTDLADTDHIILLAEDNEVNQLVIRTQLDKLGYRSIVVANGREAFEIWKTTPVSLVLTDCHMPVMDGYELAREIRKLEKVEARSATPIVAITANALEGEAEKCLEAGMDGYLAKPVIMEHLKRTLRSHLSTIRS